MEHKKQVSGSVSFDRLPPLSAKSPWLVAHNVEDEDGFGDQIFYNIHDPLSQYRCRIPELLGRRIRGCFHGWLVLSNHPHNVVWSLWNPVTRSIIRLPPLILADGDFQSIHQCCLSSPPDDPNSVLLLTRNNKPTFVFCRLDRKRKRLRWTEMSYAKQIERITGDGCLLDSLTCSNGKVFALNTDSGYEISFIHVDIVVKDREVVIRLSLVGGCPFPPLNGSYSGQTYFLKGYCAELFCIILNFRFNEEPRKTPSTVSLFKLDTTSIKREVMEGFKDLDMTNKTWEEMDEEIFNHLDNTRTIWEDVMDLKNAIFFVDLGRDCSVFYRTAIASELGGYIHFRGKMGKTIYSYHVKDEIFSLSTMPSLVLPTSHVSLWDCRLEGDLGETICNVDAKQEEEEKEAAMAVNSVTGDEVDFNESHLLNVACHILEMILEHCVGVEYMNFRATCKSCLLAAPSIKWNNETTLKRLQTHSLVSPWLMVLDKRQGAITFKDPLFGDKYFMKQAPLSIECNNRIHCCYYGWLLMHNIDVGLVFYNPFTRDVRKLPHVDLFFYSLCFSAPPTSTDCMVVGSIKRDQLYVYIHFVAQEPSWRMLQLGPNPYLHFPTFYGEGLYALCKRGKLYALKDLAEEDCSCKLVEVETPAGSPLAQYFLVKRDQQLLLVVVYDFREPVEVFKLKEKWEKIESLGKHMIYICGTTCVCVEAKIPEMENKIYFPQVDSKNGRVVFYSLETLRYHTFNGKNMEESFGCISYHPDPHAWIEPSWS